LLETNARQLHIVRAGKNVFRAHRLESITGEEGGGLFRYEINWAVNGEGIYYAIIPEIN
jgi:hypothetical protein